MKKVLGLVVSHRKLGNSELLVKEIMASIPEDCSLELLRLTDYRMDSCKACYRCLQPDRECPIDDDFNFVLNKIKEADALIIGVPVYVLGPHGAFKMLTDRLLGAENYAPYTQGKPCILVLPYGTQGWQGYSKAAALVFPRLLKMKVIDCWQLHATLPGDSLMDPEYKQRARTLGQNLFTADAYTPGPGECPACGSDVLRLNPPGRVECPLCGAQGVLQADGLPDFSSSTYCRFDDAEMEEHFKVWLVAMKHRFIAEKDRIKEVQKDYKAMDWWVQRNPQ